MVFCGADIELPSIISLMATLRTTGVEYKIAPAEGDYIIGSNSILSRESLFLDDLETISTDSCRRNKRLFDLGSTLLLLLLSPVLFWFQRRKKAIFRHCLRCSEDAAGWATPDARHLLARRPGPEASPEVQERLMLRYMRHYSTSTDASPYLLHEPQQDLTNENR